MTITQYVPRWLRVRLRKPAPQITKPINKKERQILPTLPRTDSVRLQDDNSPPGYRIQWRQ